MAQPEKEKLQIIPIGSDSHLSIPGIHHIPEFVRFVKWCATPTQCREPETQKELSELIGVCEDTLTDWKKHPQFWPLVYAELHEWVKEKIPDAVGGLYQRILGDGNPKAVEMFLRLGGIESQGDKQRSKNKKINILKIQNVPVSTLHPAEYNPRRWDKEAKGRGIKKIQTYAKNKTCLANRETQG